MEVALRARTVLRRIALWGCFGNAITHLLAVMKLRGNWVTIPPPKHSHSTIRHNSDPVSSATQKWPMHQFYFNTLSPKSDQHQFSPCNVCAL